MNTRCIASLLSFVLLAQLLLPSSVRADDWPPDGLGVCTELSDQGTSVIVSDGAGGAIIIWQDYRDGSGSADIYAQHVLAMGTVDPTWTANGVLVCNAANDQYSLQAISDGAGGAIVTWQDVRSGGSDIYAHHVRAMGTVDPGWTANGTLLGGAANDQQGPTIASDGAGGAIVAWSDERDPGNADIYAQRVLAMGTVDPGWTANGTLLCNAQNQQIYPAIVSDGAGGAIVTWQDPRDDASDIYAQHVLVAGTVDATWPLNGAVVSNAANLQTLPQIVSDGLAGAIITWQDHVSGVTSDIYAQRVLATGVVDANWTANGTLISDAANNQLAPILVSDGSGGAIVVWRDLRGGTADIYAQRVLASGIVDPTWTANGTVLCDAGNNQVSPTVVSDGAAGAIVAWSDQREALNADIYAQHVWSNGVVDPNWTANGALLCGATGNQINPGIATNMAGGAIVVWSDGRNLANADVYAQHVLADGRTPILVSLVRAVANDRHVLLEWYMPDGAGQTAVLYRRTEASGWTALASLVADGAGHVGYDDQAVESGTRYGYRLGVRNLDRDVFVGETWVAVPSLATLALHGTRPSPVLHDLVVAFSLPRVSPAVLEVFDAAGRRVMARDLGSFGPGNRTVNLGGGGTFASGVYLLRLTQGQESVVARALILR